MHNDDETTGQLLSRRAALAAIATGTGVLATRRLRAASPTADLIRLPACVARPEQTEGPYFVDDMLERGDIRSEPATGEVKSGKRLALEFQLSCLAKGGCTQLAGAVVDIWQCDAAGVYSGVRDFAGRFDTRGTGYLRGFQRSDREGMARFVTIYPGWYPGRAVHIHFKIRTDPDATRGHEFTSQLYFDEALTDGVHAGEPYSTHQGQRVPNTSDSIYQRGGSQLMLQVEPAGEDLSARFDVGLHLS